MNDLKGGDAAVRKIEISVLDPFFYKIIALVSFIIEAYDIVDS